MIQNFKLNWKLYFHGIFVLFGCFGLYYPVKKNNKQAAWISNILNKFLIAWSLLNILFLGVLAFYTCNKFLDDKSDLMNFNNILTFSIVLLTHFIILNESLFVNQNFDKIWKNILISDALIGKMIEGYEIILEKFYKQTFIKIISYIIVTFILEISIIFNIKNDLNWSFMWLICIIPLTVSRFRHLQYTIYTEILACRFKIIKNELKTIVRITKIESNQLITKNSSFTEGLYNKINGIKKIYNVLWETSIIINKTFGISQIANFLQNFVQLTCDLYVLYSFLYANDLTYIIGEC